MSFDYKQCEHYYFIAVTYFMVNSVGSLCQTEIFIQVAINIGTVLACPEL